MGNKIHDSVKVKNGCKRMRARTTTLLEQKVVPAQLTHYSQIKNKGDEAHSSSFLMNDGQFQERSPNKF